MSYIPMIDQSTGEIDHLLVIERADLRAMREYGGPIPPPAFIRNALSWCLDRARAERRAWRRDRNIPDDSETVPFLSFAPDTNE